MKYIYSGPPSGATLQLANGQTREVLLHPGKEVDLPPEHEYVKTLVALRHLKPVGGAAAAALAAVQAQGKATKKGA